MPIGTINENSNLTIGQENVRYANPAKRLMRDVINADAGEGVLHHNFDRGVDFWLRILAQARRSNLLSGFGRKLSCLKGFLQLGSAFRRPLPLFVRKRNSLTSRCAQFTTLLRSVPAFGRAVLLLTFACGLSGLPARRASGLMVRAESGGLFAELRTEPLRRLTLNAIIWVIRAATPFTKADLLAAHGPILPLGFSVGVMSLRLRP